MKQLILITAFLVVMTTKILAQENAIEIKKILKNLLLKYKKKIISSKL